MRTFQHGDLQFDVRDTGTGELGTMICLHGFPQDASSYDGVAGRLADAGMRVLVPDQRGYSPRARPQGRGAFALPELVADVVALIDAAELDRVHLMGHDWGGAVAWAVAAGHPDRVRSLTALSTPHPAALQAALLRSTQALRSSYVAFFQLPAVPERVMLAADGAVARRMLAASGLPKTQEERYVERMLEPGALTAMLGWYRGLLAARGHPVGKVSVPTTYVHGSRDPFFAPRAARVTGDFVTGDFRAVTLEAGHWLPETRHDEVADAALRRVRAVRESGDRR